MRRLPTGIEGLDGLLGGGWETGRPTLLIGGSGVGKTTLLLKTAMHVARVYGRGSVILIDCEGNVTPDFDELAGVTRAGVVVQCVNSLDAQLELVQQLSRFSPAFLDNVKLVVMDGATLHYHALIRAAASDDERDAIQRKLEQIMYDVTTLCRNHGIALLLSTWPTAETASPQPVGGLAVGAMTRTQIQLSYVDASIRLVTVVKHQYEGIAGRRAYLVYDQGSLRVVDRISPPSTPERGEGGTEVGEVEQPAENGY